MAALPSDPSTARASQPLLPLPRPGRPVAPAWLLVLVRFVVPSHPGSDLFKSHIATRDIDGTDLSAVSVFLVAPSLNLLLEREGGVHVRPLDDARTLSGPTSTPKAVLRTPTPPHRYSLMDSSWRAVASPLAYHSAVDPVAHGRRNLDDPSSADFRARYPSRLL